MMAMAAAQFTPTSKPWMQGLSQLGVMGYQIVAGLCKWWGCNGLRIKRAALRFWLVLGGFPANGLWFCPGKHLIGA